MDDFRPPALTNNTRLSVAQLAEHWECSRQHIYNLEARGDIVAMRVGSLLRFRREDVQLYEEQQCRVPAAISPPTPSRSATLAITSNGGKPARPAGFLAGQASLRRRVAS